MTTVSGDKNIVFYKSCYEDNMYHKEANICFFLFF